MNLADGFDRIAAAAARGLKPDPELRVDEWSEEHMVLPPDVAEPGKYRIDRTPPARRILQVLSPGDPHPRIVLMGASQMMKTQIALNWMLASAHMAPSKTLALEPTDKLVARLSARIQRAITDVPVLQTVFAPLRSRRGSNTKTTKEHIGGSLHIASAGAAANLAEMSARYVFIDEVDELKPSVDQQGDPVLQAEARTTTFESNRKMFYASSPRRKNGKIQQLFERGTQERWQVPCPNCHHPHELVIEHFRYERDELNRMGRAWFECPACGFEIDEVHKARMIAAGGWVQHSGGDGETLSFHVSAFYAQTGSISWRTLARTHAYARQRLDAGDPDEMQVFYNTRLALPFEHTLERTTVQELQERQAADALPARIVPREALVLTMAVDTQDNRLEAQVEAWGPGLEHWTIDHQVLMGDPAGSPDAAGSVWQRLDELRATRFMHEDGFELGISAYAIDSQGHHTQDVYNYGERRQQQHCRIIRGSNRPDRPIVSALPTKASITWGGERDQRSAELWTIGTDVAKDWLWNRLGLVEGPGAMHFNAALPTSWFEQLLAERPLINRQTGRRVWTTIGRKTRNEAWDAMVYNLALAFQLGLHKLQHLDWDAIRSNRMRMVLSSGSSPRGIGAVSQQPPAAPQGRRQLSRGI